MDTQNIHTIDSLGKPYEIKAVGQELTAGAQVHTCRGIRAIKRKDGEPTRIADMESTCCECGAKFSYTSALAGAAFRPNRRCAGHKAPGRSAMAKRKRRDSLEVKLRVRIADLEDQLKQANAKTAAADRRARKAERALARYELSEGEQSAFAAMCAKRTSERRRKLRARGGAADAAVFG